MRYTQEQLEEAFKKVQNKEHWKNEIDSVCSTEDVPVTYEAIIHFTATVPTFDYLGLVNGKHMLKVRAAGYRNGPAGDF